MKSIISIIFIFCLLVSVIKCSEDDLEMFRDAIEACKNTESLTDEEIQDIFEDKALSSEKTKCFAKCVLETGSIINDGDYVPENFVAIIKRTKPDVEEDKIELVANECADVEDEDGCELAGKLIECWKTAGEKYYVEDE